jgi:hypothetical protein
MKIFTKFLFTAAVAAVAGSAAGAQQFKSSEEKFYLRLGGGYSFGAGKVSGAEDLFPAYDRSGTSTSTSSGSGNTEASSTTKTNAPYSLGKGIDIDLGFGYMINPYVGLELGVRSLVGLNNTVEQSDNSQSSTNYTNGSGSGQYGQNTKTVSSELETYKVAHSSVALVPALRITAPVSETFSLYSRVGVSLPLYSKATYTYESAEKSETTGYTINGGSREDRNDRTSSSRESSVELTPYFKLGFSAVLGAEIALGSHFGLFGEVNTLVTSFELKKAEVTKSTETSVNSNGISITTDRLLGREDWEKITEYQKEYTRKYNSNNDSSGSSNTPDQEVSFTLPASSIGVTVGLVFKF